MLNYVLVAAKIRIQMVAFIDVSSLDVVVNDRFKYGILSMLVHKRSPISVDRDENTRSIPNWALRIVGDRDFPTRNKQNIIRRDQRTMTSTMERVTGAHSNGDHDQILRRDFSTFVTSTLSIEISMAVARKIMDLRIMADSVVASQKIDRNSQGSVLQYWVHTGRKVGLCGTFSESKFARGEKSDPSMNECR